MRPIFLALLALTIACDPALAQGLRSRHGFTMAAGVGAGSARIACEPSCNYRRYSSPMSGFLRAGFFVDSSFSLNVQARGWRKVADDEVAQLGLLLVGLQGRPFKNQRLYAEGGVGYGAVSLRRPSTGDKISTATPALSAGVGYDIGIGPGLSATPFLDLMVVANGKAQLNGVPNGRMNGNVAQLGVALTWAHFNRRRYTPIGGR